MLEKRLEPIPKNIQGEVMKIEYEDKQRVSLSIK